MVQAPKAYVAGAEAHFDNSGDAVAHRGSDGTASGVMSSLKNTFSFYKAKVAEKVSDTMGITHKGLRQQQSLDFEDDVMFVTEKATTRRVSQQSAGSRHSGGLDHGKKSRGKVKKARAPAAAEGSSSAASPRQHARTPRKHARATYRSGTKHKKQPPATATRPPCSDASKSSPTSASPPPSASTPPAAPAAASRRKWQEFRTPEGRPYFYNPATKESKWRLGKGDKVEVGKVAKEKAAAAPVPKAAPTLRTAHGVDGDVALRKTRRRLKSIAIHEAERKEAIENADFLSSTVDKVVSDWSSGKSLGTMLGTLGAVISTLPQPVIELRDDGEAPTWAQVRKGYARALRVLHPDKIDKDATAYDKLLRQRIFMLVRDTMSKEREKH